MTVPSNVQSVVVSHRSKVDITSQVQTAMTNVSFAGGVFSLDLNLKNNSAAIYVPLVELNVIKITSTSNTVSVKNPDSGGDGKSAATAALYGYSNLIGSDQQFAPSEITGNRTLQFNDSAAELFSFDVQVTAYQGAAGASGSNESDTARIRRLAAGLRDQQVSVGNRDYFQGKLQAGYVDLLGGRG